MSTTLKAFHDRLLEGKPEDAADHDASDCPFCTPEGAETASANPVGGSVSDKTYTEDEYNALAAQVEDLKGKVATLTTAAEASETDAKVATVKAELEGQLADIQSQLDAAVLEAAAAKKDRDDTVAFLEQEAAAAADAAALAERKESRIAQVKEVASFPDEYLEANADRFAAMSDELFAASLEDWKTIAPKGDGTKTDIPASTAMTAASRTGEPSLLAEVLSLRSTGVDVRAL